MGGKKKKKCCGKFAKKKKHCGSCPLFGDDKKCVPDKEFCNGCDVPIKGKKKKKDKKKEDKKKN
ncbi:MAG: hypothetical protein D6B25_04535 [Desulfobulbaceae bacterium]|nr:MAG: hypothetical protein D6B25_04535 [Desulfobulbaceae bacterium]